MLVGVLQRAGGLVGDAERRLHRELPLTTQAVSQRLTLHEGHCVQELARPFTGVEHGQDIRVLKTGGRADLASKSLGLECRSQLCVQHLQRHLAVVLYVLCEVDRRHAATAKLALQDVPIAEGGRKCWRYASQAGRLCLRIESICRR